jgi:GAF domain-containing protein/HAMP domain-containing protein
MVTKMMKPVPDPKPPAGTSVRSDTMFAITVMVIILSGIISVGFIGMAFAYPTWQYMVLSILYSVTALYSVVSYFYLLPGQHLLQAHLGQSFLFGIAMIATSALLTDIGLPLAIVYLVYTLIMSSAIISDRFANINIFYGLFIAAVCSFLTEFTPAVIEKVSNQVINIVTPAFLGVLFMIYIVMLAMQIVAATMRIRLVTAFIAIVIIPLTILSIIQSRFTFDVLRQENNRSLMLAAQQTANELDTFLARTRTNVDEATKFDIFNRYLELPADQRAGSPEETEMLLTLKVLDLEELSGNVYLASYGLLDATGINVYDTLSDRITSRLTDEAERTFTDADSVTKGKGSFEGGQDYFLIPSRTGVSYSSQLQIEGRTNAFFYVSAPVKNKQGQVTGVLRIRYEGLLLQNLLKQKGGMIGSKSYAMLVDENGIRLADTFTPNFLYKSIAPISTSKLAVLQQNKRIPALPDSMISTDFEEFDKIVKNSDNQPYFTTEISATNEPNALPEAGAIWRLSSMPWKVIYLIEDFDNAALRRSQRQLATLVTTLIAGMVGMIAVGTSQVLSGPITLLTQTAQRISMGDLEAQAPVNSGDEFGTLGRSFNLMTIQLRTLIGELEDRVKSRTEQIASQNEVLSTRARQLQTVSEVARQIVSVRELEELLSSVTQLISERFGFYHVGVFLLSENKEMAQLRAANSEGGKRMLARKHALSVGKVGIVGYVTGTGTPRIATDVGTDATFFNNPDLPNTRSEMALPLIVGGQIIGALDIQSTESNAFNETDIELFNTLADQVAIAIYNNQLYSETLRALNEAQSLHRQYLSNEWNQDLSIRRVRGYLYNRSGISPQNNELPAWKTVFNTGQPVIEQAKGGNDAQDQATLVVPISIRGETIGVVHVQDQGEGRAWTEDELTVVNSVTNQVAVALENARLFENTVRRADREKKVLEITAHIRSSNDPERMMQIAVEELQRALGASRAQIYIRRQAQEEVNTRPPQQTNGGAKPDGSNGHH